MLTRPAQLNPEDVWPPIPLSGCASGAAGMLRACIRFPGAPARISVVPTADSTIDVALRPVARAS